MSKNINIFVYGSLREGFFNYDKYLKGKVLKLESAKIKNMVVYHMPYKGYPALLEGSGEVLGEVMVLKDYENTMKTLDEMEGFISNDNPKNEYNKTLLEVEILESGKIEKCYTYCYNEKIDNMFEKEAIFLKDGDWKNHMNK